MIGYDHDRSHTSLRGFVVFEDSQLHATNIRTLQRRSGKPFQQKAVSYWKRINHAALTDSRLCVHFPLFYCSSHRYNDDWERDAYEPQPE